MLKSIFPIVLCLCVCFTACKDTTNENTTNENSGTDTKHVTIQKNDSGLTQFYIDGEPFVLKGVGFESDQYAALKTAGGNAIRTWRTTDPVGVLDSAAKYGFMVAMGLDINKELHHFDYNDEAAVAKQFEGIKKQVLQYKDHPNLLCWVAGNELNLLFNEDGSLKLVNPKTYIALNDIVQYIKEVDPNHPVTTTFAGGDKSQVELCLEHCPNLNFLSFQIYGGLDAVHKMAKNAAPTMPYVVTEFGPKGHWEVPVTEWGREIEEPSSVKAKGYAQRMATAFGTNPNGLCLGGFAFLWGQKQERTPTWYGVLGKNGEPTETVDELTKIWTGSYPTNRAPQVQQISIDGKIPTDNLYVKPGSQHKASVKFLDPENDPLKVKYTIMNEVKERSQGGAFEKEPEELAFKHSISSSNKELVFTAPTEEGDYRLFVYVYDDQGKLGYSNMPFYVK